MGISVVRHLSCDKCGAHESMLVNPNDVTKPWTPSGGWRWADGELFCWECVPPEFDTESS